MALPTADHRAAQHKTAEHQHRASHIHDALGLQVGHYLVGYHLQAHHTMKCSRQRQPNTDTGQAAAPDEWRAPWRAG